MPHLSTTPSRVCYLQTYSLLVGIQRRRSLTPTESTVFFRVLVISSFQGFFCPMHIVMTYLQVCNVRKRDLVEGFLISGIKYKLYWIITSVAYILGMVATFISLFLMNSAQPALLYLVRAFIP